MSKLPDNKKLVLINIPGTHDSCAFHMNRLGLDFATIVQDFLKLFKSKSDEVYSFRGIL